MTKKGRILITFCNIFHNIDFTQLFYVNFVIKGDLETWKIHIYPTFVTFIASHILTCLMPNYGLSWSSLSSCFYHRPVMSTKLCLFSSCNVTYLVLVRNSPKVCNGIRSEDQYIKCF